MVFDALKSKNEYRFYQFINGVNSGIDSQRNQRGVQTYFFFHLQVHLNAKEQSFFKSPCDFTWTT